VSIAVTHGAAFARIGSICAIQCWLTTAPGCRSFKSERNRDRPGRRFRGRQLNTGPGSKAVVPVGDMARAARYGRGPTGTRGP